MADASGAIQLEARQSVETIRYLYYRGIQFGVTAS